MKNKTVGRILFAVFAVALCAAAYFAADLAFFQYDDPLERATLSVVNDGEALSFTYDNDAITLHGGDNTTVYALTMGGTAVVEDTYSESFPSDFSGSFAAVQTGIREDTDGDGVKEDITRIAKTDMEYTQGYDATANAFLSEDIPLEVVYKDREKFTVYYLAKPVKNAEITVTLADGSEQVFTTDESGDITGLNLNDVRNGLTFTYRPNPLTTLSIHYQVEADTIFTARWLSAMLPFGIIILISAVCITLDVFLRKLLYKNEKLPIGKTGIMARDKRRKRFVFGFETVRWIIMILSFALLIFGSRLTGTVFSSVQLPIFACPYNLDQLTSSGCYMLSHLDVLVSSWKEILAFFGTFLVCAVLLGRVLCGFVCPLGFIQDVAHEARQALHIEGISLNERLYAVLRMVKWVMLIIFLGIGFVGGNFCDFCPAMALSPALAGFKLSLGLGGFVMVIVLVSGFFKRRCFCNICPLGFILGLTHKISLFKLKKDAVACTECGACYETCPMGIKSVFTVREGKGKYDIQCIDVTTSDCIMCGECVRCCPENNALAITFCGKKIYTADRMKFMKQYAPRPCKKKGKDHE